MRNIIFLPAISFVKYDGLEGPTHRGVILGVNSSIQNLNIDERSISVIILARGQSEAKRSLPFYSIRK